MKSVDWHNSFILKAKFIVIINVYHRIISRCSYFIILILVAGLKKSKIAKQPMSKDESPSASSSDEEDNVPLANILKSSAKNTLPEQASKLLKATTAIKQESGLLMFVYRL